MKPFIYAIAFLWPITCVADCKSMAATVDAAHKDIAAIETSIATKYTPESVGRQKQANHLAAINATLLIMQRANCPIPADAITGDGSAYSAAAGACAVQGSPPEKCQRDLWKRNQ